MTHPALIEHRQPGGETYLQAARSDGAPDFDPERDMVMRASTVSQADLCPGRVWHRADRDHDETPGEVMVWGTIVHALIQHQVENPDVVVGQMVAQAAADKVEGDERLPFLIEDDVMGYDRYVAWVGEARDMANAWRAWCRRSLGFPLVGGIAERRLMAPLFTTEDGRTVWLGGTPDLILPDLGLGLDWKTANKGWPASRAAGQNQHYLYAWLAREVLGVKLDHWWYVVGNRATGRWEHFGVPIVGTAGINGCLERAEALARSLLAGARTYHPKSGMSGGRGWWCQPLYCAAWNDCPARFLGDDKDRLVRGPAESGWAQLT